MIYCYFSRRFNFEVVSKSRFRSRTFRFNFHRTYTCIILIFSLSFRILQVRKRRCKKQIILNVSACAVCHAMWYHLIANFVRRKYLPDKIDHVENFQYMWAWNAHISFCWRQFVVPKLIFLCYFNFELEFESHLIATGQSFATGQFCVTTQRNHCRFFPQIINDRNLEQSYHQKIWMPLVGWEFIYDSYGNTAVFIKTFFVQDHNVCFKSNIHLDATIDVNTYIDAHIFDE